MLPPIDPSSVYYGVQSSKVFYTLFTIKLKPQNFVYLFPNRIQNLEVLTFFMYFVEDPSAPSHNFKICAGRGADDDVIDDLEIWLKGLEKIQTSEIYTLSGTSKITKEKFRKHETHVFLFFFCLARNIFYHTYPVKHKLFNLISFTWLNYWNLSSSKPSNQNSKNNLLILN